VLPGTLAAAGLPYRRQVFVSSATVLGTGDLGALIIADSSAGSFTVQMPAGELVNGGTYFQVVAINAGTSGNSVTVALQGTDTYNDGLIAPIVLSDDGATVMAIPKTGNSDWTIPLVYGNGGGGGGGGSLTVEDEGVIVDPAVANMNFVGGGVLVTPNGAGSVDVAISGAGIPSGPLVPEGNVLALSSGELYARLSNNTSTFWQFLGVAPSNAGWVAVGPVLTAQPVGPVNGANQVFTFPGGVDAVDQGANGARLEYSRNGLREDPGVDYTTAPGGTPGTTVVSFTTSIPPSIGDFLEVRYIPA